MLPAAGARSGCVQNALHVAVLLTAWASFGVFALSTSPLAADTAPGLGVILFARPDVEKGAYGPLSDGITSALASVGVNGTALRVVSSVAEADAAAAALPSSLPLLAVGHGMVKSFDSAGNGAQRWAAGRAGVLGLALVAGFLERAARPDVVQCAAKAEIQPKRSLKCPLGCLEDGARACEGSNVVAYDLPILTVAGELDGVVRLGRIAEAIHTQMNLTDHRSKDAFAVVPGMAHASVFADASSLPAAVSALDIAPETTSAQAIASVAGLVATFVVALGGGAGTEAEVDAATITAAAASRLDEATSEASTLLGPLVDALALEGSWFLTGADDEHGSSEWSARAQQEMGSPLPPSVAWGAATSEFHLLSDEDKIPPYYRDKHRATVTPRELAGKTVLDSEVVTQLRYVRVSVAETKAGLDGYAIIKEEKAAVAKGILSQGEDGSAYVSALEVATKMRSRQLIFNSSGVANASESLDDGNRCASINRAALSWALGRASAAALARFKASGFRVEFGDDEKPFPPAGPWWIWTYLKYDSLGQKSGKDRVTDVESTRLSALIPDDGLHESTAEKGVKVTSIFAFFALTSDPYGAGNHCESSQPAPDDGFYRIARGGWRTWEISTWCTRLIHSSTLLLFTNSRYAPIL